MTGTLVVDASFVMVLLTSSNDRMTTWANDVIHEADLVAPHLMPVEVTSALRNAERRELVTPEQAALTHEDLVDLDVELHPFDPFASRVWALRHAASPYDAWYVALAERLDAPLVTIGGSPAPPTLDASSPSLHRDTADQRDSIASLEGGVPLQEAVDPRVGR